MVKPIPRPMHDVAIVGGGVAGLVTGIHALRQDPELDVMLLERRPEIGLKACSGGMSKWLFEKLKLTPPQSVIASKVGQVKLISPGGTTIRISASDVGLDTFGIVFDRGKLDKWLADTFQGLGGEIITGRVVKDVQQRPEATFIDTKDGSSFVADYVVCADGTFTLARNILSHYPDTPKQDIHTAAEYYLENDSEDGQITIRFDGRYAPRGYTWHFPHGKDILKVGCGVPISIGNPIRRLNKYIDKFFPDSRKIKTVGACIPTAKPLSKTYERKVVVVGDAARQTDALTGGGLATGIKCGQILGETIASKSPLSTYDRMWKQAVGGLLRRRYKLKCLIYSMTQKEIDKFFTTLSTYKLKSPDPRKELARAFLFVLSRHPNLALRYLVKRTTPP